MKWMRERINLFNPLKVRKGGKREKSGTHVVAQEWLPLFFLFFFKCIYMCPILIGCVEFYLL
jgi:hypothetical protein